MTTILPLETVRKFFFCLQPPFSEYGSWKQKKDFNELKYRRVVNDFVLVGWCAERGWERSVGGSGAGGRGPTGWGWSVRRYFNLEHGDGVMVLSAELQSSWSSSFSLHGSVLCELWWWCHSPPGSEWCSESGRGWLPSEDPVPRFTAVEDCIWLETGSSWSRALICLLQELKQTSPTAECVGVRAGGWCWSSPQTFALFNY